MFWQTHLLINLILKENRFIVIKENLFLTLILMDYAENLQIKSGIQSKILYCTTLVFHTFVSISNKLFESWSI